VIGCIAGHRVFFCGYLRGRTPKVTECYSCALPYSAVPYSAVLPYSAALPYSAVLSAGMQRNFLTHGGYVDGEVTSKMWPMYRCRRVSQISMSVMCSAQHDAQRVMKLSTAVYSPVMLQAPECKSTWVLESSRNFSEKWTLTVTGSICRRL
jgi:hypothetical protein